MRLQVLGGLILVTVARAQTADDPAAEPVRIAPPLDPQTLRTAAALLAGPPAALDVSWIGVAVGADLQPLAGVDVWLYPDGATLRAQGCAPQLAPAWSGMRVLPPDLLAARALADCTHVVSGADGSFRISQRLHPGERTGLLGLREVPAGAVVVLAREGYACRTEWGSRWDQPGPEVDLGQLVLVPEGAVAGRVVDASGAPVAGAEVTVLSQEISKLPVETHHGPQAALLAERHSARTGADGRFRLAGLWPGRVNLGIDHPAHPASELKGAAVRAGETSSLPDIALGDGVALSGVVVDARGRPVAGARVAATSRRIAMYGLGCVVSGFEDGDDTLPTQIVAAYGDARIARTDAAGTFSIDGLTATSLLLFAEADGFAPGVVRDLVPPRGDVRLILPDLAELQVRVMEAEGGAPLPQARLAAWRRQQRSEGGYSSASETDIALQPEPVADAPGTFRVRGAGPMRTGLIVAAPGFAPASVDVHGLQPGAHESVEVRLQPAAQLRGRVVDAEGLPVPSATATLYPGENRHWPQLVQVSCDASGGFSFPCLGGGRFDLLVKAPGHAGQLIGGLEADAALGPIDVTLAPSGSVQASLHDGDGRAIAITADLVRSDLPKDEAVRAGALIQRMAQSDAEGRLRWSDLPAGQYALKVRDMPDRAVEVRTGETTRVELDGGSCCRVEGHVTRDGEPLAGAQVALETRGRSGAFDVNGWAETDASGDFAQWVPAGGPCRVVVQAEAAERADGGPKPCALSTPVQTVETGGQASVHLDVSFATGSMAGRLVRAGTGEPLADATVRIVQREVGADESYAFSFLGSASALTDEQGRFLFVTVPDGDYVLERVAMGPIVAAQSALVQVRDGRAVQDIRIEAPHGASLACTLRRLDGTPAPDGSTVSAYLTGSREGCSWGHSLAGRSRIEGLLPGHYRIEVMPAGKIAVSHEDALAQEVDLPENGEVTVEFVFAD